VSFGAARWLVGLALATFGAAAQAHKSSDSYLQIEATANAVSVRWDIALRDLDVALDLDTDDNGMLTWGEIKSAWPRIETYATERLSIARCPLHTTGRALERRNDGAYAVLFLASNCSFEALPVVAYSLFRDVDPTHRGIMKVQRPGQALAVVMLDPSGAVAPSQALRDSPVAAAASAPEHEVTVGAWGFLREGIRHILTGYDHVLFLLCLLLPSVLRRTPAGWRPVGKLSEAVWPVIGIVSAFTVAHSLTLGLAATKLLSLSPAFIEPAIAVTIILAALDNVWPIFPVRRVVVTFFFGLIHGFGFAGVLSELNLPKWEFARALLEFNIGLEMGQLVIVIGVTALLFLLRERRRYPSLVLRGGSFVAMLIGALWLIERTANVSLLPF
jgi:HupE / UreJ protein